MQRKNSAVKPAIFDVNHKYSDHRPMYSDIHPADSDTQPKNSDIYPNHPRVQRKYSPIHPEGYATQRKKSATFPEVSDLNPKGIFSFFLSDFRVFRAFRGLPFLALLRNLLYSAFNIARFRRG
jgi:hypothetical protein